jgi:predicted nucleotidyltransferase
MARLPDNVADFFRRWAEAAPEISHLWLYGSRARGTHDVDSDIDIAVGIMGWDSDSENARDEAISTWLAKGRAWKTQLQAATLLKVHLNPATHYDETVLPAIIREGVLLYSA